jgi:hypothetical protein
MVMDILMVTATAIMMMIKRNRLSNHERGLISKPYFYSFKKQLCF